MTAPPLDGFDESETTESAERSARDAGRRVLLVDDDPTFCRAMGKALSRKGFVVRELHRGTDAIAALSSETPEFDVVVLDLQMPDVSGMQVLKRTPRRHCPVVVLTGHGTVPDAVEAMRLGAFSFLLKPIDADELVPVLLQAVGGAPLSQEHALIGDSPALQGLREVLESCAQVADPVLLYGETGTGKEVAARYLHARSRRASQPLLAINLACLPRELVESELFGHARGAFTGADRRKRGLFAEAGQGTLFLDEISELPLELQPKLLRALETRTFRPVGETREQPMQARLVCATNRDLRSMAKRGQFREDLYYRLAVLPVELPPLRSRVQDIVPIAEYWLSRIASLAQGAPPGLPATSLSDRPLSQPVKLTEDARQALREHDYPGNVRELVNVVRRIALFARSGVADGGLVRRMLAEDPFRTLRPERVREPGPSVASARSPAGDRLQDRGDSERSDSMLVSEKPTLIGSAAAQVPLSLRELEIQHIERLLREHKNITTVAKLLEIDRRTLQRKLRSLGIDWRDEG
jgi:DNA-binding NtrC family response regulator